MDPDAFALIIPTLCSGAAGIALISNAFLSRSVADLRARVRKLEHTVDKHERLVEIDREHLRRRTERPSGKDRAGEPRFDREL